MLANNASIAGQSVADAGQEASNASPLPHTPSPLKTTMDGKHDRNLVSSRVRISGAYMDSARFARDLDLAL